METVTKQRAIGTDGAGEMEGDLQELQSIRQKFENYNRYTFHEIGAASRQQAEELMNYVRSERNASYLKEFWDKTVSKMGSSAKKLYEVEFLAKLSAESAHIGTEYRKKLIKGFKDENVHYKEKEKFVREKLPSYIQELKKLDQKREELLNDPDVKALTSVEVKELEKFKNRDRYINLNRKARAALVSTIEAARSAKSRKISSLYGKAKMALEGAARKKAISWNKIGPWLERIFKNKTNPKLIEDFLNDRGNMPLSTLINNWTEASHRFENIEEQRKKKGTPRGVHFVKMEVFLNWHFERRKAYLDHTEESIEGIGNERDVIVKIRHELGAQDWDSAEHMIAEARREPMTEAQNKRLNSMEKYLREHRKVTVPEKSDALRPANVIIDEINSVLSSSIPPQLQKFYRKTLNRGYQAFWAWTTLMYNRVWCHQHNYLDENKEKEMEKSSKEKTRKRMKEGHSNYGLEANVVKDDTNAEAAIRDQDGVKGAQILYVEEDAHESLTEKVNEHKNNRNFWYWTSVIPEGVKYPEHLYIVQAIHPKLKKLARELEQAGGRFPLSGLAPSLEAGSAKEIRKKPVSPPPAFSVN